MIRRRHPASLPFGAACALALASGPSAWAQNSTSGIGSAAQPRSTNERVVTEGSTPSTINRQVQKDEAAAEGARPARPVPNIPPGTVGSSAVAAPAPLPGTAPGVVPGEVPADPRIEVRPAGVRPMAAPGLDVAMLIEHALGMAIEATALQSIAAADPAMAGPSKELFEHGRRELQGARDLLVRAAEDGRSVPANSPTRRFYDAANSYITTLSAMSAATPAPAPELARVAMVNHSVKEALDANHIASMGRVYGGSAATEQMLQHARKMKDNGMQAVLRMAGNATAAPAQPGAALLAQHGRALLEAADQIAASVPVAGMMQRNDVVGGVPGAALPDLPTNRRMPAGPGGLPANGENPATPGRFQDNRPEIVGGTFSTGAPAAGVANQEDVKKALKDAVTTPNPDPNPAIPNTPNTLGPDGKVVPLPTDTPPAPGTSSPR